MRQKTFKIVFLKMFQNVPKCIWFKASLFKSHVSYPQKVIFCIPQRHNDNNTPELTNQSRYESTYFIPSEHQTINTDTANITANAIIREHNPKPTFSVKKWKKVLYIIGLWLLLVLIALAMFIITRGWDFKGSHDWEN